MGAADRLPAAAAQAARDRGRLRASEGAVANDVIEFQLARQRLEAAAPELIDPLSPREREVLDLVASGRPDGEIAERLFISKKTASVHVANIKHKLGASSRVEIALLAARLGLVPAAGMSGSPDKSGILRAATICPYKGLASFEIADAGFFFGRERVVGELIARLAGSTFVGVVGPSGSGKSSVVRAGIVPALAAGVLPGSDRWPVAVIRPGAHPTVAIDLGLAGAIRRGGFDGSSADPAREPLEPVPPGQRIVLIVDQFEELFTVCESPDERAAAVRSLVSVARDPGSRALLVLAVRADFYGRCAEDRDLAELLGTNHVLVGPMSREELARAVELPARAAKLRVEPELTARLVDDVADRPGGLPVLSTTLLDLWQRRDGRTLRFDTYVRIGGVSGAVARLAETAFTSLSPTQQADARAIFLRLAGTDARGVAVRRPVPIADLEAPQGAEAAPVLKALVEARLLTVDGGSVEIAHEALLSEWPRLREWLEHGAEDRRIHDHLTRAARDWDAGARDPDELYAGARLMAVLEWAATHDRELNTLERRYLAEGRQRSERVIDRERRANRRLRNLFAGTAVLLILAIVAGGFGVVQQRRAEEESARAAAEASRAQQESVRAAAAALRAEQEALVARSRELAASAVATLDDDPSLSKLLALEAASISDPPLEARATLHQAWAADRIVARHSWTSAWADQILEAWADVDVDGGSLVRSGLSQHAASPGLEVVDLATGTVRWMHHAPDGTAVGPSYFIQGGEEIVTAQFATEIGEAPAVGDVGILVFDSGSGDLLERIDAGPCGASLSGVGAGRLLALEVIVPEGATGCAPYQQELGWRVVLIDRETRARREVVSGAVNFPALSGDGRIVAFEALQAADDGTSVRSRVVEVDTGRMVLEIDPADTSEGFAYVRRLNHDGSLLLYGDRPIQVVDVSSGHVIARFRGHAGESYHQEFSASGETVYSTGRDLSLRHWDARTAVELAVVPAIGSGRPSPLADGSRVLVPDFRGPTAAVAELGPRGEIVAVETCRGEIPAGSFDVADTVAVLHEVCDGDSERIGITQIADLRGGDVREVRGFEGQVLAISPDGSRFVHQRGGSFPMIGPLVVRALPGGDELVELDGTCTWNAFLPDRLHSSGCRAFPEAPFPLWLQQVAWSPDGARIVAVDSINDEAYLAVWTAADGRLEHRHRGVPGERVFDAIFTPDSRRLIVSYFESGRLEVYSTADWARLATVVVAPTVPDRDRLDFVGFSPDGSTLLAVGGMVGPGGGSLHWFDPETLAPLRPPIVRAHDGSPKSADLSPSGGLLATGASGDPIRIWDPATGRLVHEIPVGDVQVQGVAFVDDHHLAMTPQTGSVFVFALDLDELLRIVRGSLTRGFTPAECARYGFDPCPTVRG